MKPLEYEYRFFKESRDELLKKYAGSVLVIVGQRVAGVFDSEIEAFTAASQEYEPGEFLIQRCTPGDDPTKQVFHSRTCFA